MERTFSETAYHELVTGIFQRFPSVQQTGFQDAYKPGLERMEAFCEALGHPERAFRSIHVAGTNGKGSVSNMLCSALSAVGIRTGLYTSPHLLDFRERIRLAGQEGAALISKEYVFDFLTRWKPYFEQQNLSFFEITTGLAFRFFADAGAEAAVIETGLGGRLDSTNVILPQLSIVTTIGLDHCQLLGNTLAEIAAEKAGIFKPGVPALVGETQEETAPVFNDKAWMFCPLSYADALRPSAWYRRAEILSRMDLVADVQERNLRTVLAAVDILSPMPGFKALSDTRAVLEGIAATARRMDFRGRWEKLSDNPCVLCDIGHNPQAIAANAAQLRRWVDEGRYSSLIIVYGVMADKDLHGILPLLPTDATYIFAAPDTPRALPAEAILRAYQEAGGKRAYTAGSVRQAVQMAIGLAQNLSGADSRSASAGRRTPPLVFIGGSAFVVAEALPLFR